MGREGLAVLRFRMYPTNFLKLRFPYKLWILVNDADTKAIRWTIDGKSIVFHSEYFAVRYLKPHIFRAKQINSIKAQFNFYGFRKTKRSSKVFEYRHINFRKNQENLLQYVVRKIQKRPSKSSHYAEIERALPQPKMRRKLSRKKPAIQETLPNMSYDISQRAINDVDTVECTTMQSSKCGVKKYSKRRTNASKRRKTKKNSDSHPSRLTRNRYPNRTPDIPVSRQICLVLSPVARQGFSHNVPQTPEQNSFALSPFVRQECSDYVPETPQQNCSSLSPFTSQGCSDYLLQSPQQNTLPFSPLVSQGCSFYVPQTPQQNCLALSPLVRQECSDYVPQTPQQNILALSPLVRQGCSFYIPQTPEQNCLALSPVVRQECSDYEPQTPQLINRRLSSLRESGGRIRKVQFRREEPSPRLLQMVSTFCQENQLVMKRYFVQVADDESENDRSYDSIRLDENTPATPDISMICANIPPSPMIRGSHPSNQRAYYKVIKRIIIEDAD